MNTYLPSLIIHSMYMKSHLGAVDPKQNKTKVSLLLRPLCGKLSKHLPLQCTCAGPSQPQ